MRPPGVCVCAFTNQLKRLTLPPRLHQIVQPHYGNYTMATVIENPV